MINPLFLPQNTRRRKKSTIEETPQNVPIRKQFKLIHQLDCIYQGQINHSYQKEGFAIQQTNDFHTYIGFWKCNKINGIGMIIYPEGGLIYGNFKDNQILGVGLTDNKRRLRIGIFENCQITGIGFQYYYADTKWKFCRFHKGVAIESINQVVSPIEKGPPSIMNLHQDMYILLSKYLNQQFFDIPVKSLVERPYKSYTQMNVHQINSNYIYLGQAIASKYWGLGLIFDKVNGYPIEIGFYENGQLNGYGLKSDKDKNQIQMGLYTKGKKEGFFYEKKHKLQMIVQYQQNYCKGQSQQMTRQKLRANQKIYNYQKNDFFSQKNKINFKGLRILLQSSQKQLSKLNQNLKNIREKGPDQQKVPGQKNSSPKGDRKSGKNLNEINISKSTVQVIREKLGDIQNLIKRSKAIIKDEKQKKQSSIKHHFLEVDKGQNPIDLKFKNIQDDQVYQEEQPVQTYFNISDFSRETKRRGVSPTVRSPLTARKPQTSSKIPINNTTSQKLRSPLTGSRLQPGQFFYMFQPKTNEFSLSPAKTNRSVSSSSKVKKRIFE